MRGRREKKEEREARDQKREEREAREEGIGKPECRSNIDENESR
jgi:hypothetical protein